jgi:CheY-like chemotaxis protein
MSIKKILIVDDELLLLELLSEMLDQYICFTASHLKQVDDILKEEDIDVILCDVVMPGGGGIELFQKLKENAPQLVQKLIFITGGSTNRDCQDFLQKTDRPVIYKPFREKDILSAFSKLEDLR